MTAQLTTDLPAAVNALRAGGVIAYPTESCFGIGCDPRNLAAIERILHIKQRSPNKGLILIAASVEQAQEYVSITGDLSADIHNSWPGPHTWLLPTKESTEPLLRGDFPLLAIRVTAHPTAKILCELFGGAIVSTSANLAGETSYNNAKDVFNAFSGQLDTIVNLAIGADTKPSQIHHGLTGEILRK